MSELKFNKESTNEMKESYIKQDKEIEQRKMFANKKINIALIVVTVIIVGIYIASFVLR